MTKSRKPFYLAALVGAMILLSAWQGGNVSSSTITTTVFSGVSAVSAVSAPVQNIGQASHWLVYCINGGTALAVTIQLEASYDNVTWFAITPKGTSVTGCAVLESGGYFSYVRANLLSFTANGTTLSATYSASGFPISSGGLGQVGKTPFPVTYVPTLVANCFIDNATGCAPIGIASGSIIYGVALTNTSATPCVVTVSLLVSGGGSLTEYRSVTQNTTVDVPVPAIGVDAQLTLSSSLAPGANTCIGSVFYKGSPRSSSKVNGGGTEASSTRTYP